jgi:hypothetical protein
MLPTIEQLAIRKSDMPTKVVHLLESLDGGRDALERELVEAIFAPDGERLREILSIFERRASLRLVGSEEHANEQNETESRST